MARTSHIGDVLVALFSLAFLITLVAALDATEPIFVALAIGAALLYLATYLIPGPMRRIISVPEAFHLRQNWGSSGFEMQAVSYSSYHTTLLAGLTHVGFVLDAAAWLVLAAHYLGWYATLAVLAIKVAQVLSYRELRLSIVLGGLWIGLAAAAGAGWALLGSDNAARWAAATVVVMAVWRTIGHATEPIPPGVSGTARFVPLEDVGLKASLGVSFVVGIVAEFAAGIPFRLVDVWTYDVALRRAGFRPDHLITYEELDRQRQAIFEGGWAAAPATAHLAEPQLVS